MPRRGGNTYKRERRKHGKHRMKRRTKARRDWDRTHRK